MNTGTSSLGIIEDALAEVAPAKLLREAFRHGVTQLQ
jgi:hypothetical protein